MLSRSPALLFCVMIVMAAVVTPTIARMRGRKNCSGRKGRVSGCNSNVSLFKRLLDERYRELLAESGPEERGDDTDGLMLLLRRALLDETYRDLNAGEMTDEPAPETRDELHDLEKKIQILHDLLFELNDT